MIVAVPKQMTMTVMVVQHSLRLMIEHLLKMMAALKDQPQTISKRSKETTTSTTSNTIVKSYA
jgi:hypothetical protein